MAKQLDLSNAKMSEAMVGQSRPKDEAALPWRNRLPPALRLYVLLSLVLDLAVIVSIAYYHARYHDAQREEIWSTRPDMFGDFWHYRVLFLSSFHTSAFFSAADRFAYPAPCAVMLNLLYKAGNHAHQLYALIFVAVLLASAFFFYRILKGFGWRQADAVLLPAFLAISSYPWIKLFDRSNLELFVYIFLALGVWAFATGRENLAAVLWGFAASLKIYPLLICAVFFRRKSLRPLAICLLTFAGVLLLSFWFVGPTIHMAALGSFSGVSSFIDKYGSDTGFRHSTIDHSILGSIKEICLLDGSGFNVARKFQNTGYQIAVVILGPILYFLRIRKLPAWNQLSLFLIGMVILPPVSFDYTLIHVYLAFGIVSVAYLASLQMGQSLPMANWFFAMFALVTSSQGWIQIGIFHLNGLIKTLALLTLCGLLLAVPLTLEPKRDSVGEGFRV